MSHLRPKCRGSGLSGLFYVPCGRRSGARPRRRRTRDTTAACHPIPSGRVTTYIQSFIAECSGADTPLASHVERVEKPTDNRPARLLCSIAADADSLGDRPIVGPGASPIPLPRRGQCCFDGSPKSRAEGFRSGTEHAETSPRPARHCAGDRRSSPRRAARRKSYARPAGDSAFRRPKSGRQCEYCGSVAIRTRRCRCAPGERQALRTSRA